MSNGSLKVLLHVFVLASGSTRVLNDDINLVLQDDNVLEFHDLHGDQVLLGLRLWAWFITSNKQKSAVHDRGTGKHGCHEHIVTWTINERDVAHELQGSVAVFVLACEHVFLGGT